jgi:vancomycin resistance protein YoaR
MTKWYHIGMRRVRLLLPVLAAIAVILTPVFIYNLIYSGRIFPNTFVSGINLSGKNINEAILILSQNIKTQDKLVLTGQGTDFTIDTKDIDLSYDLPNSVNRAYNLTRTGNILFDLFQRVDLLIHPKNLGLAININEEKLGKVISVVSGQNSKDPVFPVIKIVGEKIQVERGSPGTEVDQTLLRARIGENLSLTRGGNIEIPIESVDPSLNDEELKNAQERAEKFVGKSIQPEFEFNEFNFKTADILSFLDPKGGFNREKINEAVEKIASQIDREAQNPKFNFEGGRVTEFQPALDGIETEEEKFREKLMESINTIESGEDKLISFEIPITKTAAQVETGSVNNIGIKELIGRGSSRFRGSISSRIHNIKLASSHLNGILIKPGDTFSFNDALGDVSKFTGYREAYIISEGKTILGDGGGVCQVSTTLFRAALNAGLPILERQAHAYRVGYYEQDSLPGLDATVYGPSPDLKIKNDTPAHILIQARADSKNYSLVFELYGTGDGRTAMVSKPITTNVVPAGDDLYIDDPTLPAGTVKQTEHKANGAKVTFNYSVQRNGETIYKKTFISNYRPWQAVYLRGTGPVQ